MLSVSHIWHDTLPFVANFPQRIALARPEVESGELPTLTAKAREFELLLLLSLRTMDNSPEVRKYEAILNIIGSVGLVCW